MAENLQLWTDYDYQVKKIFNKQLLLNFISNHLNRINRRKTGLKNHINDVIPLYECFVGLDRKYAREDYLKPFFWWADFVGRELK